ncbi:unnamed protein product, partial [Musa textilis]
APSSKQLSPPERRSRYDHRRQLRWAFQSDVSPPPIAAVQQRSCCDITGESSF